jgi:hypothetical protein
MVSKMPTFIVRLFSPPLFKSSNYPFQEPSWPYRPFHSKLIICKELLYKAPGCCQFVLIGSPTPVSVATWVGDPIQKTRQWTDTLVL